MKTVFIIEGSSGEYDDYGHGIARIYEHKADAEEWVNKRNAQLDRIKNHIQNNFLDEDGDIDYHRPHWHFWYWHIWERHHYAIYEHQVITSPLPSHKEHTDTEANKGAWSSLK